MHVRTALSLLPAALLAACQDAPFPTSPSAAPRADVAASATFTVTTLADADDGICSGDHCTLREAIAAAAVNPGSTIDFAVEGTIALALGQLLITEPMTIAGPGADALTVRASGQTRVLLVQGTGEELVTIDGLTIADGDMGGPGGCIQSEGSYLKLVNVVVTGCRSQGAGGAVGSSGDANGFGRLEIDHSLLTGSWAADDGGGVYNNHNSRLFVTHSTIAADTARDGGGIGSTGYVVVVNSTVSGNRARRNGGGIYAADRDDAGMQVVASTVVGNHSDADGNGDGDGGGFFNSDAYFSISGSIVANNVDATPVAAELRVHDCGAVNPFPSGVTNSGRNLIESTTGCTAYAGSAIVSGVDPLLGALADNGGATPTHLPLAGSPAIDGTGSSVCYPLDQRDLPRPVGPACDIGAVEVQPLQVTIDVKPGSATNPVSLRAGGTLPVAVLSTASFDARTVVVSSLRLQGQPVAPRPRTQGGGYMAGYEDVNGDGRLDLVVHFTVKQVVSSSTTTVTLTGAVSGGGLIAGSDVVTVVP